MIMQKVISEKTLVSQERLTEFIEELRPLLSIYHKDDINAFYSYWTGGNKKGKTKWDMKTFNTKKRLSAWIRNKQTVYPKKNKIDKFRNILKNRLNTSYE